MDAYNAQLASYQQTILLAFGQVADALSALEHDAESVSVSRHSVEIASASAPLIAAAAEVLLAGTATLLLAHRYLLSFAT